MCEYIKAKLPAHLPLHEHQRPGVHRGARPPAGALRHRRGDVLDRRRHAGQLRAGTGSAASSTWRSPTSRAMADEKRANGRDVPFLNWRYILFNWNDSDEEMDARAQLAADIGVDRLCWEITDHPRTRSRGASCRARRRSRRSGTRSGTTTTWATRFPARRRGRASTSARCCRGCRWSRRPGRPLQVRTRVRNLSTRAVPGAGELRPPPRAARRAALRGRRHAHRPRLRARVAAAQRRGRRRGRRAHRDPRARRAGPLQRSSSIW